MRLESSIKELHDMFMDIAMLVENQVTGSGHHPGEREESSGPPEKDALLRRVDWKVTGGAVGESLGILRME